MFSIPHAASSTVAMHSLPKRTTSVRAELLAQATSGAGSACSGLSRFCDSVERTLRDGEAISGAMRAASLSLIVRLDDWPEDQPIRLHTEGDDAGRRYGPRASMQGYVESVHVKHDANGRYGAAAFADDPPARWVDCGAEPDSLFEAVLVGLELRNALAHMILTDPSKRGDTARCTDARWLRERVAEDIRRNRAAALQVLLPVFLDRDNGNRKGKVDAQMLHELREMGPHRIEKAGRVRLSAIYNVPRSAVPRCVSSRGDLAAAGQEILRREQDGNPRCRIDGKGLAHVARLGPSGVRQQYRSLRDLATSRGWSYAKLTEYFDPVIGLTRKGQQRIEHRDALSNPARAVMPWSHAPLVPDPVASAPGAISTGHPPQCGDPNDPAWLRRVAQMTAEELLQAGGLVELAAESSKVHAVHKISSDFLPAKEAQRHRSATDPAFVCTPLTAARFRDILAERCKPDRKTPSELIDTFGYSVNSLEELMYSDYLPKPRGVDLLWRELLGRSRKTIPLGTAVLQMMERMHVEGRLPTDYHVLVVAHLCNVSFHKVLRCITSRKGLTPSGKTFLKGAPSSPLASAVTSTPSAPAAPPDDVANAAGPDLLPPDLTSALLDLLGDELLQLPASPATADLSADAPELPGDGAMVASAATSKRPRWDF